MRQSPLSGNGSASVIVPRPNCRTPHGRQRARGERGGGWRRRAGREGAARVCDLERAGRGEQQIVWLEVAVSGEGRGQGLMLPLGLSSGHRREAIDRVGETKQRRRQEARLGRARGEQLRRRRRRPARRQRCRRGALV